MILSPTIPAILSATTFSCAKPETPASSSAGNMRCLIICQKYNAKYVKYPRAGVFNKKLERSFYFFFLIGFDDVSYADIIVILNGKTAFHAGGDFFYVFLEPFERCQLSSSTFSGGIDDDTIADQADLGVPEDLSIEHIATCDGRLVEFEDIAHFDVGHHFLLDLRFEHAFHSGLDFFDGIVNDRIGLYFHSFIFSQAGGLRGRVDIEANDNGVGGGSQQDIAFS